MDTLLEFDIRPSGKILFAEDFDLAPGALPPEPEVIEPTFSAADLEAARTAAWAAAHTAAAAEAAAADHAAIRQSVAVMAEHLAAAREELALQADQAATAIAELLLASLGAVLPALAARYGEAELTAMARIVLPGLFREPAVTVRLNPQHCAAMAAQIERLDPDLAARVQIVPAGAIPPGDARIAWRNGSAVRDTTALWTQVVEALGLAGLSPAIAEPREIEHAG